MPPVRPPRPPHHPPHHHHQPPPPPPPQQRYSSGPQRDLSLEPTLFPREKFARAMVWMFSAAINALPASRLLFNHLAKKSPEEYAGNNGNSFVIRAIIICAVIAAVWGFLRGLLDELVFSRFYPFGERASLRARNADSAICILLVGIAIFMLGFCHVQSIALFQK